MPRNLRRNNKSTNSLPTSRSSEITGKFLPPSSEIPIAKWQEIMKDEHVKDIVDFIREEIVQSAADAISKNYFQKAVYGFVVDCAYEAWLRAFQWAHLEYDNQGMSDGCPVPDEAPPLIPRPRLRRGVPTVYGRLAKLMAAGRKSTVRAKNVSRGKSGSGVRN